MAHRSTPAQDAARARYYEITERLGWTRDFATTYALGELRKRENVNRRFSTIMNELSNSLDKRAAAK